MYLDTLYKTAIICFHLLIVLWNYKDLNNLKYFFRFCLKSVNLLKALVAFLLGCFIQLVIFLFCA